MRAARVGALLVVLLLVALPPAQAVVHIGSTSASGTGSSRIGTVPSGTLAGQVLLAQVVHDKGTGASITAPAGWTLLKRTDSGTALAVAVYWRRASASEPSTYTWTFGANAKGAVGISAYADVDPTTAFDAPIASATADATTLAAPSVTTTTANALLVVLAASARSTSFTPAAGMTERYDRSGGVSAEAADATVAAIGPTGTRTVTAAAKDRIIAHTLALRTAPTKTLSFNASASSALESSGTARFGVAMSAASTLTVRVDYTVSGTATAVADHGLVAGTLVFSPGQTFKGINASIVSDATIEPDETLVLTLSNPRNATLGAVPTTTHTIRNDDAAVGFTAGAIEANESAGSAALSVVLAGGSALPISASYAVTGGSASAGSDFTLASGTLLFAPGQTSLNVTVGLVDSVGREADETVVVQLTSAVNATIVGGTATLTIHDDDPLPRIAFAQTSLAGSEATTAPTFAVTLTAPTFETVTVGYEVAPTSASAADVAVALGTLTFPAGATAASIGASVTNDAIDEEDEAFTVRLVGPTNALLANDTLAYTILDDDAAPSVAFVAAGSSVAESAASATVAVALSGPSGKPIAVPVTLAGGTAGGSDHAFTGATLSLPVGATGATLAVPLVPDALLEGDETLLLVLGAPTNALLGAPSTHTLVLLDDEAPISARFGQSGLSVPESAGSFTATVLLSGASADNVSVAYAIGDGAPSTLVFAPGEVQRAIAVPLVDDDVPGGDRTLTLALVNATGATVAGAPLVVAIVDDDPPYPTVQFGAATSSASETAGSASVLVTLSGAYPRAVAVAYAVASGTATGGADYSLAPGTVSFAPGQTSAAIVVPLVDDAAVEDAETIVLALSSPTRALLGALTTHTIALANDDLPPVLVQFAASSSIVSEAARVASVTLLLSRASNASVVATVAATSGSARGGGIDHGFSSEIVVFAPGETARTVALEIVDDGDIEPDETIVLALSAPVGAAVGAPAEHTLTLVSDDTAPLVVQFLAASGGGSESATPASVTVVLSASSGDAIVVAYDLVEGTATPGIDFEPVGGTLAFAPGSLVASFPIEIVPDAAYEGDETIVIALSDPTDGVLGTVRTFTYTILDDDPAPTREIVVASAPLRLDGTPDTAAAWGGWSAEAGATNVGSTNYLKIVNAGSLATPSVVVSFAASGFVGAADARYVVPLAGNVQFAWWEDTTPGASAPSEGAFSFGATSAGASVTIPFTGAGNIVYVAYRIVAMPGVLADQTYATSFTVSEL